ncbi:hypothetical protein [Paraburkholderia sp. SIMBA_054]|uniref:hypothetical protein n=1 Tax=Paraburkholderia sp. SIMBA_054 TaxID=3085795 RepID=UPI00397C1DFD
MNDTELMNWLELNPNIRIERLSGWTDIPDTRTASLVHFWQITDDHGREFKGDTLRDAVTAAANVR